MENSSRMSNSEFAHFENAALWRAGQQVFERLDLHIDEGERVAVIGPNGCGKSTLLKAMSREIYPASNNGGIGRMFGRDIENVWQLRKRMGFVSDEIERRYTPNTTVVDTIASGFFSSVGIHGTLAQQLRPRHRDAALAQLGQFGLNGLQDRQLRQLSSGERRRCFLARALVHAPRALVLDEPTSGLDFKARFELIHSIEALDAQTLVFVTHDLNDIPRTVERIILLQNGSIVADGQQSEVLTSAVLSGIYGLPIRVVDVNGYRVALPGGR